ncbi:MAG TPA: hypothetical protein VJG49_02680 [Candidatus Nanoarchaeia archaeon]|nr:hypothetical protein [Candidatus Nanoarchaeia archaeon]
MGLKETEETEAVDFRRLITDFNRLLMLNNIPKDKAEALKIKLGQFEALHRQKEPLLTKGKGTDVLRQISDINAQIRQEIRKFWDIVRDLRRSGFLSEARSLLGDILREEIVLKKERRQIRREMEYGYSP